MRACSPKQRIARVGHVAVLAATTATRGVVEGVLHDSIAEIFVALEAGFVSVHERCELVTRFVSVHLVT